jgi:hypothetical protein
MPGIIIKGHKDLHNLFYPVASLGAAAELEHIYPSKRHYVREIIMRENQLEDYGLNGVKGSLSNELWRVRACVTTVTFEIAIDGFGR